MYQPTLLDKIKHSLTLSEVIGKTVPLRKKGHEFSGCCPFHQEKTPSFTVNNQKAFYHCFGCGAHGSIFDFLQHQNNVSFMEAVRQAAEMVGIPLPVLQKTEKTLSEEKLKEALFRVLEKACLFFERQLQLAVGTEARNYLLNARHLTPQTLKTFRLGFSPDDRTALKTFLLNEGFSLDLILQAGLLSSPEDTKDSYDKFRNRVMFPIRNRRGRVVGFGGRILGTGDPKYLNSPATLLFNKGGMLYNFDLASTSTQRQDPLLVVEGYMDVISLHQKGYERVVAPLGTALTEDQIRELWQIVPEPVLCFDGDVAGHRAALRAAERALPLLEQPGKSLSFLPLPANEDPDTLIQKIGLQKFRDLFSTSVPLIEMVWKNETEKHPGKTPEQKALLQHSIETLLTQIKNSTIRHYYSRDLKNHLYAWGSPIFKKEVSFKKSSLDVLKVYEEILIATILLHPHILEAVQEDFALFEFNTKNYGALQKEVLFYFYDAAPIEKTPLHSYLKECGYGADLEKILSAQLKVHAPFLERKEDQEILEGWHHIRDLYQAKSYGPSELRAALDTLDKDFSEESWRRYKHLKEVLHAPDEEK
jgi:DNA primase